MSTRSKFTTDGATLVHTGTCPHTGESFTRRYWCPADGGYVYCDASADGRFPGTLGRQPTTDTGSTWHASDRDDMAAMVRRAWRRERADAARI